MRRILYSIIGLLIATVGFSQTDPTTAATEPTHDSADVISMFCGAYTNVNVDTWRTSWSSATLEDVQVAGNDVKKYTSLDFVGIETTGANLIDASGMNYFNVSVWTPNSTTFRVKLVDFGADGAYQGGDDTEHEVVFDSIAQNQWVDLMIPMSDFTNLTGTSHIAQLIFSSAPAGQSTVFIDNVYFLNKVNGPTAAAMEPTHDASNVISMFCGAYTDVNVDTWRTSWSSATLEEVQVAGNDVKKYSALDFVGIETTGANLIDASEMEYFNVTVWTGDATTFRVKLVDFGADGGFQGGDDSEHEIAFDSLSMNEWVHLEIPMSDFTGLSGTEHIAQLIFSALPSGQPTVYVDNVYFHKTANSSAPNVEFANSLTLFPNPTNGFVTLKVDGNNMSQYMIKDVTGKAVATGTLNGMSVQRLDVSALTQGTYFVDVVTEKGTLSQKLIIH